MCHYIEVCLCVNSLLRHAGAEHVGSYALVCAGCDIIVVDGRTGAFGHLGVVLTFGLVVAVMIASVGHISDVHFNPAKTVTFAAIRRFKWRELPVYAVAQLVGVVLAAATLYNLFGSRSGLGATLPQTGDFPVLVLEALLTAVLVFVITTVATDATAAGHLASLAIGATVTLDALWGSPISSASMNPSRSFGPALPSGTGASHWIYWVGPIAGALIGAGFYQLLAAPNVGSPKSDGGLPTGPESAEVDALSQFLGNNPDSRRPYESPAVLLLDRAPGSSCRRNLSATYNLR